MTTVDNRNRLSGSDRYKLTKWLEANTERFTSESTTQAQAAAQATEELGFTVSKENVASLCSKRGDAIIQHSWPASQAGGSGSPGGSRQMQLVVAVVNRVLATIDSSEDHVNVLGDLAEPWKELVSHSGLASDDHGSGDNNDSGDDNGEGN